MPKSPTEGEGLIIEVKAEGLSHRGKQASSNVEKSIVYSTIHIGLYCKKTQAFFLESSRGERRQGIRGGCGNGDIRAGGIMRGHVSWESELFRENSGVHGAK